jgi:glycosyltransferase involved in cell wall biosynthesis/O-antigen/teichoic acid export membrane protein
MNIPPKSNRDFIQIQRIAQALIGLITLFLLVSFVSLHEQGWYYSFISLGAIYVIFDHGLSSLLINKIAAMIPRASILSFKDLQEAEIKTFHTACFSIFQVYLKIASIFFLTVTPFGLYFFSQEVNPFVGWTSIWITLVAILTIHLLLMPFSSLIEGLGAIREVYKVRLIQNVIGGVSCWVLILSEHILWATIALPLATVIIQLLWLLIKWPAILKFISETPTLKLSWSNEMRSLQSKVAVSFFSNYVFSQLLILILFKSHGPSSAAIMAVSLTILNTIALVSFSSITSAIPQLTREATQNNWGTMDGIFRAGLLHATIIYFIGSVLTCLVLLVVELPFIMLPLELFGILSISIFANQLTQALIMKGRAYLQDPLMPIALLSVLLLCIGLFFFTQKGGIASVTLTLFYVQSLVALPLSYIKITRFEKNIRLTHKLKSDALNLGESPAQIEATEPKVAILMTTFNGATHLNEQLTSIENQSHKNWELHISDDGSTDATLITLRSFASIHIGKVHIYQTKKNLGFVQNFFSLICHPKVCGDYYALSDQDDIWCTDRLIAGIQQIPKSNSKAALYCSRTLLIDERGRYLSHSPQFNNAPNFRNALIQSVAGGNTMIFNHATQQLVVKSNPKSNSIPSHDWWMYILVSGHAGIIRYDANPHVLYRQHNHNLVGTNVGLRAAFERLNKLQNGTFKEWNQQNIDALNSCRSLLTTENEAILDEFIAYRKARFFSRIICVFKNTFPRQTWWGNMVLRIALFCKRV